MRTYKAAQAAGNPHDEQKVVAEEARKAGLAPTRVPKLFTGSVWGEVLMPRENDVGANKVTFAPGSRTAWHRHDGGQMLFGLGGNGLVVTRSGEVTRIFDGVVVHAFRHEEHWHGAVPDSFMTHLSCELVGEMEIYDEVTDSDYAAAVEKSRSL
ncbi:MAG: cupin domain-containing protein [Mycobacterium sp.]